MPDTALSRKRQMRGNAIPPVRSNSAKRGRLHPVAISRVGGRCGSAAGTHLKAEITGV
jgi:hypothetical protein